MPLPGERLPAAVVIPATVTFVAVIPVVVPGAVTVVPVVPTAITAIAVIPAAVRHVEVPGLARQVAGAVAHLHLDEVAARAQVLGVPDVVAFDSRAAPDVAAVHAQGDGARVDAAAVVVEARGDARHAVVLQARALRGRHVEDGRRAVIARVVRVAHVAGILLVPVGL